MKTAARNKKTDIAIRHVTSTGANVFAELGFSHDEAQRLKSASDREINQLHTSRTQLIAELVIWISSSKLTRLEAAERLCIPRSRVADIVNYNTSKLTIDVLVGLLARAGKRVKMIVST